MSANSITARAVEREQDNERTVRAAKELRSVLRAVDRELKDALDGGVDLVDAQALWALATQAQRAGADAAYTLRQVTNREHGRQERERVERAEQ